MNVQTSLALLCGALGSMKIFNLSLLLMLPLLLPGLAAAQEKMIPQKPAARIIVDNDFAGDPDGLAALAHQLLSPKTRTVLITSSALNPAFGNKGVEPVSARKGRDLAVELVDKLGVQAVPVAVGAEIHGAGFAASDAALAIVQEAMRDDALPLIFTCGGPLTNLAAALQLEPAIAERMKVIWIGGGAYPEGGREYNLATDLDAARYVIEKSGIELWQIPVDAYRQMQYSVAEMAANLRPVSPVSRWLYDRYTTLPDFVEMGGSLTMGDHPLVLLTALSHESSRYSDVNARRILDDGGYGAELPGRTVRVFDTLDARLTFADFLALLRLNTQ